MNKGKKLLVAMMALAALSGCASTQYAERSQPGAQVQPSAVEPVSRPASYGSLGGYRYRRFSTTVVVGA